MLKIHHLGMSRSERVVWLAEELGLDYELVRHQRDPQTMRAPASLWAVSPMGKAPVIQDGDTTVTESGVVVEYLIDTHGAGRLRPRPGSAAHLAYLHWSHAAEATLMVPILLELLTSLTQTTRSAALEGFIDDEYATTLGYLDKTLTASDYVAGAEFTGADVMVAYALHLANGTSIPAMKCRAPLENYPSVQAYLARVESRPAFVRARGICSG